MAAKLLLKRTSVTGRAPNTSNLDTGELALNMTDGIMYSTNGSVVFEIGANVSSLQVNGQIFPTTDGSNGQVIITDGSGNLSWANQSGSGGGGTVDIKSYIYTISSNTTVIEGNDDDGVLLSYTGGQEDIYLNGIKLISGDDYSTTNTSAITLAANAVSGDKVEVVTISGSSTLVEYQYTVSANQTIFTGTDDNSKVLTYTDGRELVFLNGIKLVQTDDYTTPNSSHIILTANAVAADVLEIVSYAGSGSDLTDAIGYSSSNTDALVINTYNKATYRTAKYIVQANTSDSFAASEATVIHDGTTAYITEYGELYSNNILYNLSANVNGSDVELIVTPTGSGTTFKTKRIAIKV